MCFPHYFLLPEISKCSVPNGSFFPRGIDGSFQQSLLVCRGPPTSRCFQDRSPGQSEPLQAFQDAGRWLYGGGAEQGSSGDGAWEDCDR